MPQVGIEAYSFSTPLLFSHDRVARKYSKAFRFPHARQTNALLCGKYRKNDTERYRSSISATSRNRTYIYPLGRDCSIH